MSTRDAQPMVLLPRLTNGNVVAYATDDELRASAETYLSKGSLLVLPEGTLEPLSVLEVHLTAPRLPAPLTLRCEVVVLQAERALLRVLDPPPEAFAPYLTLPEAPVEPEAPPEAAAREEAEQETAPEAPQETAAPDAVVVSEARVDDSVNTEAPVPVILDPPPSDIDVSEVEEPTAAEASLPPHLSGDVLRFASENDFNVAGRDLYLLGAVLATSDSAPLPGERRALKLEVESRLARTTVATTLQPGAGGMVVVQLDDKEELARVLPEVLPPKVPPEVVVERVEGDDDSEVASEPTKRTSVALVLASEGRLRNPTTVEGLLALSVMRPLTAEDLALPSTHLLLRWLLTSKGILRVDAEMLGHPAYPFLVIDGREVRSPVAMPALGRNLVEAEGTYSVVELKRPPRMTHSGSVLQLLQEVVSGLVGKLSDDDLERGLGLNGERCPQLNDVGQRLLEGLGFSSSHKRLAQKALTGKESVFSVTQHAAGARSAFEVLYALEVSGALDWVDGEGVLREEKQRKEKERLDRLIEGASGFWDKIKRANHFDVMGLHWSTPPRKIKPAFEEMKRIYGPGGEARAGAEEVCDRIWAKVSEAYSVLSDPKRRRAHRKEEYALQWSAQIDVLLDRADIAMYRKEFQDSLDLITVCQDIQPTPAAVDRLAKLKEAQAKAKNKRDISIEDLDLD